MFSTDATVKVNYIVTVDTDYYTAQTKIDTDHYTAQTNVDTNF